MLVITRKTDESLIIQAGGEEIEISVLETAKDKVKLGVRAPLQFKIMRSELVMAKSSNIEASQAVTKDALAALMRRK